MKRSVLLITDADFWRGGAGSLTRIGTLATFLETQVDLTVIYLGMELATDQKLTRESYPTLNFVFFEGAKQLSMSEYSILLKKFLKRHSFDICILEYVHLSILTRRLPWKTKIFLDMHDIISDRSESFRKFGVQIASFDIPAKLEYKLFKLYDKVIVLTEQDYLKVAEKIGNQKVLLVPHACVGKERTVRLKARQIAFIASDYYPNVEGLQFFLENIWPAIQYQFPEMELYVYGLISRAFNQADHPSIQFRGFVPDVQHIYDQADIVINPVRFGSGLKIKNIEALANGIPLVTMRHGAAGLFSSDKAPFLVADSADDFIGHLCELIRSAEKREMLADRGFQYAKENYSPERCFGPLVKAFEN